MSGLGFPKGHKTEATPGKKNQPIHRISMTLDIPSKKKNVTLFSTVLAPGHLNQRYRVAEKRYKADHTVTYDGKEIRWVTLVFQKNSTDKSPSLILFGKFSFQKVIVDGESA